MDDLSADITLEPLKNLPAKFGSEFVSNLLASSHFLLLVLDKEGRIILFNKKCEEVSDYSSDEAVGKIIWEFLIPDSVLDPCRDILQNGREYREEEIYEGYWTSKGSKHILIHWTCSFQHDEEANLSHMICLGTDITAQKSHQKELHESEERFRFLIENQGDGISLVDENEVVLYANPAADALFGIAPESLIGRSLRDFVSHATFEQLKRYTKRRKRKLSDSYEMEIIRPDGSRKLLNMTVTPKTDKSGNFVGAFGIFKDITKQRYAEKWMRKSEEKYLQLFKHSLNGFVLLQMIMNLKGEAQDAICIEVNEAFEQMTNMKRSKLLGERATNLFSREQMEPYMSKLSQVASTGESLRTYQRFEAIKQHLDILLYSPTPGQVAMVLSDISEQEETKANLQGNIHKWKTVASELSDGLCQFTLNGTVLFANKAYNELIGITEEINAGTNILDHASGEFKEFIITCLDHNWPFEDPDVEGVSTELMLDDQRLFCRVLPHTVTSIVRDTLILILQKT